jgi:hypothetical protein
MKLPTHPEAVEKLKAAMRAAAIEGTEELRHAFSYFDVPQLLAVAVWINQAWNNGYVRGSDDATLKHVYTGIQPAPATNQ